MCFHYFIYYPRSAGLDECTSKPAYRNQLQLLKTLHE